MTASTQIFTGYLWTGSVAEPFRFGRLLLQDGCIAALQWGRDFDGGCSDCEGEAAEEWIIPGLIDPHAHLMFGEADRSYEDVLQRDTSELRVLRALRNAALHQGAGVTTLRDAGSPWGLVDALREAHTRGYITGPQVLSSGPPLTLPQGHFWWCGGEVKDTADAIRRVGEWADRGADYIKIMASGGGTQGTDPREASFSQDTLSAIVETAHARGLRCAAHAEATVAVERAVRAGVDVIEHAGFLEPDGTRSYRADLVDRMARDGLVYSPTIQTAYRGLERGLAASKAGENERRLGSAVYKLRRKLENLRRFRAQGVRIVAGTDAIGQFGDVAVGLELFTHAGLSPWEALHSALLIAAEVTGRPEEIGSLAVGTRADVVVLRANPLEDFRTLYHPVAVYQGGERVVLAAAIHRERCALSDGPVASVLRAAGILGADEGER